jgi:hypothetical protein
VEPAGLLLEASMEVGTLKEMRLIKKISLFLIIWSPNFLGD